MNLLALKKLTEQAEGRVNHFYLDALGKPTIGVGRLVPTEESAVKLAFAPPDQIREDYRRVCSASPGLLPSAYSHLCTARMPDEAVDALLEADMQEFVSVMKRQFPEYETWPETVQEAVFDIDFNVGPEHFSAFHHLIAGLHSRDWKECAAQCHRKPPVSEERNKRTAALFLAAA